VSASQGTPYERIGGEAVLRRMTVRMYALMDRLPEAQAVRALHPPDLAGSEQKLFEFLSGWLGGTPLFAQRHGAPMLRAPSAVRHRNRRDQRLAAVFPPGIAGNRLRRGTARFHLVAHRAAGAAHAQPDCVAGAMAALNLRRTQRRR